MSENAERSRDGLCVNGEWCVHVCAANRTWLYHVCSWELSKRRARRLAATISLPLSKAAHSSPHFYPFVVCMQGWAPGRI